MDSASQYSFDLHQILRMLLKENNIHSGYWSIGVEFGFAAITMGPTPAEAKPSGLVQVNKVLLTKYTGETNNLPPLTIDASTILMTDE